MRRIQIIVLTLQIFNISTCPFRSCPSDLIIDGYYWKEYAGIAPSDALKAGVDYNGRDIYVGQVLFDGKLIAGKIYESDNKIYFGQSGIERTATKHTKILCSQTPEKFIWINTTTGQIPFLTTRHLLIAGDEGTYILYVGRRHNQFETGVGKIAMHIEGPNNYSGLWLPYNGKETLYSNFEILAFDPK